MLNQADLQRIFQLLPVPSLILSVHDQNFTIAAVNDAYLYTFSLTDHFLPGRNITYEHTGAVIFLKAGGMQLLIKAVTENVQTYLPALAFELPVNDTADRQTRYFDIVSIPVTGDDGKVEYILHTLYDVTDTLNVQKEGELTKTRLHETSLLMAHGQELANFGNWTWDIINNKVTWSAALYQIYGLDQTTFKATFEGYQELLHPDDRERVYNLIGGALASKNDVTFEERIIRPDGEMRYLRSWGRVQTNADGVPVKMIGACLDITDSKLAELRLKEMHNELAEHAETLAVSEKKYSDLFHFSPLPMWVVDLDELRFVNVNEAAIQHYGYSREEFLSMHIGRICADNDLAEKLTGILNHDKETFKTYSRHLKSNGEIIQVLLQSNLIQFNGHNACLLVANDITERQNYIEAIEKRNNQLQEIAWIQSHVVRAPLARLMGLAEVLKSYSEGGVDTSEITDRILTAAHELDEIIKSITEKSAEVMMTTER